MTERRRERADAARNRRAILRAAEDLLARYEPDQVSVEKVASAAGVGKGTVFHRFGSRVGLMRALMQERALALHEAATGGPPPLGPGAPPAERIDAFLDAVIALIARNAGLIAAHEHALATQRHPEGGREQNVVYGFWHDHIAGLIREARPDLDADLLAHILIGSFHNEPITRLLRGGEYDRVARGLRTLATALLASPEVGRSPGATAMPFDH